MKKSSLMQIISTFSKEDFSKFEDFVKSPYFNKKSNVIKLYLVMKKSALKRQRSKPEKEEAWKKIFPGKKYNYGIMKNLIHDLTKLAENYLSNRNLNQNFNYEKLLIDELFKIKAYDQFMDKLKKYEKKINSVNSETGLFYDNMFFMYDMYGKYHYANSPFESHIKDGLRFKNLSFMLSVFKSSFGLLEESLNRKGAGELDFAVHVLKYFENHEFEPENDSVVKLYYYALLCLLEINEDENYLKFKKLFDDNKSTLSRGDRRGISDCLRMYYETKHRKGTTTYSNELMDLNMEMINTGIHSVNENDYVDLFNFRSIILSCRRTFNYEKLEKFIEESIHKVHPKNREALLNFSYAALYYMKNEYKKVLYYCSKINLNGLFEDSKDNVLFKDDLRYYSVKASYELGYYEEVLAQLDAYKHFLKNSKIIPEGLRNGRMHFLGLINDLVYLNTNFNSQKYDELQIKIEAFAFEKRWLREKYDELEKRNGK